MGTGWTHRQLGFWFNLGTPTTPNWSAGGSSGGAASALASGMLCIADGSDMMGSLRTPAAFQGLIGFRPTPGVALATEMDPMGLDLVSIGPMARNVADANALFTTLSGRAPEIPACNPRSTSLAEVKVGWLGSAEGRWPIEPSILSLLRAGTDVACHCRRES